MSPNKIKKKSSWDIFSFGEITSIDESTRLIKEIFWTFMGLGLLMACIGIILPFFGETELYFGFIMDGFVYIVLSLIFFFKKSRVAAILLLLVAIGSLVMTTLSKLGLSKGGSNIFLAIIVLVAGIHGVRATFAYHKLNNEKN